MPKKEHGCAHLMSGSSGGHSTTSGTHMLPAAPVQQQVKPSTSDPGRELQESMYSGSMLPLTMSSC